MWEEAGRIEATVARLADSKFAHPDIEVIFVDDGSSDGTAVICEQACARYQLNAVVRRLPVNRGKGAAVRHGVLAARGRVIGFSDADLSCGPDDIEMVFATVSHGDADVAVASRTTNDTTIAQRQPWARRAAGSAFNLELRLLGLTELMDTQCGLKAFSAAAARLAFEPMVTQRFAFDVEALARCRARQLRIVEVPVTWTHVEASRVAPVRDGLQMAVDAARIKWSLHRK
ncbi:MAG: glycosyl transferase, family 2 [Acidimicrobiia bacterium]|nr:glycosyl transferase, family 2 [Acidimicrobiia bacterium]